MLDFTNMDDFESSHKLDVYGSTLADILGESVEYKKTENGYAFFNPLTETVFLEAETIDALCVASIYYGLGFQYGKY